MNCQGVLGDGGIVQSCCGREDTGDGGNAEVWGPAERVGEGGGGGRGTTGRCGCELRYRRARLDIVREEERVARTWEAGASWTRRGTAISVVDLQT